MGAVRHPCVGAKRAPSVVSQVHLLGGAELEDAVVAPVAPVRLQIEQRAPQTAILAVAARKPRGGAFAARPEPGFRASAG